MLKPAMMFGDRAVLQREKKIAIWGEAEPGNIVNVRIQGQEMSARTDKDGKWIVWTEPLRVSDSEELVIESGEERIICHEVMVGDVYFAGGQSNMEFHMRYDADLKEELQNCTNPCIRFFDYPEVAFPEELSMADYGKEYGFWRECDAENLERFSAVAYYCVRELQKRYKIPMGILACNWGGTPAMAWLPEEVTAGNGGRERILAYHKELSELDLEDYERRFMQNPFRFRTDLFANPVEDIMMFGASKEEMDQKNREVLEALGVDLSVVSPEDFVMPMGPKHEWRPAGVYESMLLPCVPYGLKGILWYQGCSDAGTREEGENYRELFPALIRHFRQLFKDELPFLFVQLAPFGTWMDCAGTWYPFTRESQQWTADHVPGAYMAVTTDVGMEYDIHPKKKQPVGHRLALLAEHYVYGEEDVLCEAPTLIGAEAEEGKIVLTFDHAGEGLYLTEKAPYGQYIGAKTVGGLSISSEGKNIDLSNTSASAKGNTVVINCPEIHPGQPLRAALAKTDWYLVNLYNSAGIPARPAAL